MTTNESIIQLCEQLREKIPTGVHRLLQLGYEVALDDIIKQVSKLDRPTPYTPTGETDISAYANTPIRRNNGL